MSTPPRFGFNTGMQTTTAFLGGIAFAAMFLIMELREQITNFEILMGSTALASVFLLFATFGRSHLLEPSLSLGKKYEKAVQNVTIIGFTFLLLTIPIFILEFNQTGAILIAVVEFGTVLYVAINYRSEKPDSKQ